MDERPRSEDRRVKKTRSAIYEAFLALLSEKKYSEITVKEVTERADITRKTFYLHYGALDDVLREFIDELMYGAREEISSVDSAREGSSIFFESAEDDYSELFSRLNRNFGMEHPRVLNLINDDVGRQIVYQSLMERQKTLWENFREQYGLDPEVVRLYGTFTTYGFIAMYMSWYSNADSIPIEKFAEMTRDISNSLHGLLEKWQEN